MKKINVGIIGWGFMGKTHTMALRTIPLLYPGIDFEIKLRCICTRRIEKAHEAGLKVNCWTVNTQEDGERVAAWGVDFITTNILE